MDTLNKEDSLIARVKDRNVFSFDGILTSKQKKENDKTNTNR